MTELELSDIELKILQYVIEGKRNLIKSELGVGKFELHQLMVNNAHFAAGFRKAREVYLTDAGDNLINMAEDQTLDPMRLKLKSDNTKWLLSKMLPAIYGDKVQVQIETVDLTGALADARARTKIAHRTTDVITQAVDKTQSDESDESDIFS